MVTSPNNDGWTGATCPRCCGHGHVEGQPDGKACQACGGTGEEYVRELDERETEPTEADLRAEEGTYRASGGSVVG
jgi:RecJ-like exonuclease